MKKILILAILIVAMPLSALAVSTSILPFGGFVGLTHIPPNVGCASDLTASPFWMIPAGISPPGPWSKSYGLINVGLVTPGAWILGKYRLSWDCVQVNGPEVHPFPTFHTDFYGTSIPKPIPHVPL